MSYKILIEEGEILMEECKTFEYNGKQIQIRRYFSQTVVKALDLINAFVVQCKSGRDAVRHGITPEYIVKIPINNSRNSYWLTKEGALEFVKKYSPKDEDSFRNTIEQVISNMPEEDKIKVQDPYFTDLLEDILRETDQNRAELNDMKNIIFSMYSRQMTTMLDAESLIMKCLAMLLRAESMGPVARLNKGFTKDIVSLAKDAINDAVACEATLDDYEHFKKEAGITDDDELPFRTQKKDSEQEKK